MAAKKKDRKSDKRERILAAAITVFAKNGFYDTRVSEIAKAAGVADGTIYLYFKNKDDVLVSIFSERIEQLIDVLTRIADREDKTPEQKIRKVIELQLGVLEGQRDLAEVITVNLRQSSRLLKQYAAPLFTRYLEVMARIVADGQEQGAFRRDISPVFAARSLWGGLDGIALTWAIADPEPTQLRKAAQQYERLFLDGLTHGCTS